MRRLSRPVVHSLHAALLGSLLAATTLATAGVEAEAKLTLPAGAEITVNSPASLPVLTLPVEIHKPVKKNTVILQIDKSKLEKELEGTRKSLASAQAEKRRLAIERRGATSQPTSQDPAALRAAQEIGMAEAAEQRAMSDISMLQMQIAESTVKAPEDGYVTKQLYAVAAKTKRRKPLLMFAPASKVILEASLPAAEAAPFAAGTTVRIAATGGAAGSFQGKVLAATPAGESVALRIQPLELAFLTLGQSARISLTPAP